MNECRRHDRTAVPPQRAVWLWLGVALAACGFIAGCKSTSEGCQRQIAACLTRCDASGVDLHPSIKTDNPQNTITKCESDCQKCRSTPGPAPVGPPTPTGTAP